MRLAFPPPRQGFVLFTALALLSACGEEEPQPAPAPLPSAYTLPGDAVHPEGVTVRADTRELFVTSFTQGTVFRGSLDNAALEVFLPSGQDGRNTANGLTYDAGRKRLIVAGGTSGLAFAYDAASGALLGRFDDGVPRSNDPARPSTFVNDVTVLPSGDAYFTDSLVPTLWRAQASQIGKGSEWVPLEPWLDLRNTAIAYQYGADLVASLNLNGIVSTEDGRYLLVVQTNTGKLFRIDAASKAVAPIAGANIPGGDGLVLRGRTLYGIHVAADPVVKFELSADYLSATPVPIEAPTGLKSPTTAAIAEGRLLIVNSQFDKLFFGGAVEPPFTLSSIPLP